MKEISDLIQKIVKVVNENKKAKDIFCNCNYNIFRWLESLQYNLNRTFDQRKCVGSIKFIDKSTFDVLTTITDLYPNNEVSKRLKSFLGDNARSSNYYYKIIYPVTTDLSFNVLFFGITDNNEISVKTLFYDDLKEDLIRLYEYLAEDKHKKLNYGKFTLNLIVKIQYIMGERGESDGLEAYKPGKFLTKLFPDIKSSEIGNFVDYLNALRLKQDVESKLDFNIIEGLDICYYYNENNYVKKDIARSLKSFNDKNKSDSAPDTLNKSCMRHDENGLAIEFYSKFPDQINLAILTENNKLRARCLLWNADDGSKYYDRVYYLKTSDYDQMVNTLIKEGYKNCSCSNREKYDYSIEVTISKTKYETVTKCPYLDTLNYFILGKEPDDLILLNNNAINDRRDQNNHVHSVGITFRNEEVAARKLRQYNCQNGVLHNDSVKLPVNKNNVHVQDLVYNKTLNRLDTIDNCTYNNYLGYYISSSSDKSKHILNVNTDKMLLNDVYYYLHRYFHGCSSTDIPLRDKKTQTDLVYSTVYGYKIFKHRATFVPVLNTYIYQKSLEHKMALQKIKKHNV